MPPKHSAGKEKDLAAEEEVLQAVILADSFNKRFKPLTVGKPRCLLPVCNATLLDWTFESLALAGVQEIFVICRSYAEQVKAAIRDSKWSKPSSGLKIVPIITSKETFTPGDAMRDIYTHGIITSDFVLVTGDLVSNVRIDEVVRVHKERRRTNKDAIMTMVVKESGAVHRTRSKGDSGVFVLDPQTSECLHFEPVTGYPSKKYARIPREILEEHPEVEIRNDLIDCSIDVCSVEVPSLFQDNFDYGDIRRDFVHGVLTSDLLMKNIYCYVVQDGYAARVADTRSYDAVSKDILSRWTFPLVPDDNHPGGHVYEHLRGNTYIAKGNSVVLSRTCKIGPNSLIGAHTQIADNVTVQASVIGQRCTIGPNVVLRNAYIFDDTHIGASSVVEESIVGSRVRIGEGSRIERGSLVGDGVVLGKGARLGRFERVSTRRVKGVDGTEEGEDEDEVQEEDSELEEVEPSELSISSIVGEGSTAIVWPKGPPEDDEDVDEVERYANRRLMRLGDTASDLDLSDAGSVTSEAESDSESEAESSLMHPLSRTSSATSASIPSAPSALHIHTLHDAAAHSEFYVEVTQSLERAFAEGHSVDNAAVELKTLRMASNVPLRSVREAVVGAIVEKIAVVEGDAGAQRREIGGVVSRWGPLIDKIGGVDAVETVEVLQYHCARSTRLPLFGQILAALYQDDIVEEDDIRAWHVKPAAKGEDLKPGTLLENVRRCWAVGAKMIEQFDEQESDSEDDGEEEDDEEKDDEEEEEEGNKEVQKPDASKAQEEESEEDDEEEDDDEDEDDEGDEDEEDEKAEPPAKVKEAGADVKNTVPQVREDQTDAQAEESEEATDEEEETEGSSSEEDDSGTQPQMQGGLQTSAPVKPEPSPAEKLESKSTLAEKAESHPSSSKASDSKPVDVKPVAPAAAESKRSVSRVVKSGSEQPADADSADSSEVSDGTDETGEEDESEEDE